MKVVKRVKNDHLFLGTNEIDVLKLSNLNKKSLAILKHLARHPMYPKELSRKTGLDEQMVYYYVKKLQKMGFIEVEKIRKIKGVTAKVYKLTADSFFFKLGDFKKGLRIKERSYGLLEGFIKNRSLNSLIIVGSPDPHGSKKVRSRDGYLSIDLALFLGSFTEGKSQNKVRMDLSVREEELKKNNLIVVGGPVVNKVSHLIIGKIPIYIDPKRKKIISTISKKEYSGDKIGVVCLSENPFNPKKKMIYLAGLSYYGTRSAVVALRKRLSDIEFGNKKGRKMYAKVVKGLDLNNDGFVDDVQFLE